MSWLRKLEAEVRVLQGIVPTAIKVRYCFLAMQGERKNKRERVELHSQRERYRPSGVYPYTNNCGSMAFLKAATSGTLKVCVLVQKDCGIKSRLPCNESERSKGDCLQYVIIEK